MRKLSEIFEAANAAKSKINVSSDSINYISASQLKKYLEVADKFLSEESKEVINWLIVNNSSYIADLSTDNEENALAGFYNAGVPKESHLKELYKALGTVVKSGRVLEIPVFQTKEQFESIISKQESPDTIILDLNSDRGRGKVTNQYRPLLIKICKQWNGKSNLSYDDLMSAAQEGFVWALNGYGKKTDKNKVDLDTIVSSMTFGQYAAYMIRSSILASIKNESKTVREPISAQNKERKEKGFNRRSNSISGNRSINKDDEGGKTLFDFIGGAEEAGIAVDRKDLENLWQEVFDLIKKEFNEKIFDTFCSSYGINGYKKMKNKDIAEKYGISKSNVSYYCYKVENFINTSKNVKKLFKEILDLYNESMIEADKTNGVFEMSQLQKNESIYND